MIRTSDGIAVWSNWDSGTHLSFGCGVEDSINPYTVKSLDKVLTSEQIKTIEMMIATLVSEFAHDRRM